MRASGTRRSHVPELWDAPASDWGAPHRSRTLQLLRRRVIFYKKSATKFQLSSTSHRGAKLQRLELAKRKRRPTTTAPNLLGFFFAFFKFNRDEGRSSCRRLVAAAAFGTSAVRDPTVAGPPPPSQRQPQPTSARASNNLIVDRPSAGTHTHTHTLPHRLEQALERPKKKKQRSSMEGEICN